MHNIKIIILSIAALLIVASFSLYFFHNRNRLMISYFSGGNPSEISDDLLQEKENKIIELQDEVSELEYKISEYEDCLEEANTNISDLNSEVEFAQSEVEAGYDDLSEAVESIQSYEEVDCN